MRLKDDSSDTVRPDVIAFNCLWKRQPDRIGCSIVRRTGDCIGCGI